MDMGGGSVLEFLDRIDPVDTGQGAPPGLQPMFNPPPVEQAPITQPQHLLPQAPPPAPPSTTTAQHTQTSRLTRSSGLKGPQGRAFRRQDKTKQKKRQKQNRREADRVEKDTPSAQSTPAPAPAPPPLSSPAPSPLPSPSPAPSTASPLHSPSASASTPSPTASASNSTPSPPRDPVVCEEEVSRYIRRRCTRFTPIIEHRIPRPPRCCSTSTGTRCLDL
eukprot:TRINITY_DN903_c0_g1_i16.p1 TRINITY_DN903_c0_g1~~TRINITY_DN903_c0_g1_i16.p1  ORF type:complete len:220 (+),score=34.74 TRINITY_DN903_c0_g1_i16:139-798(+)